jgi:predicted metal-binding membrane protein
MQGMSMGAVWTTWSIAGTLGMWTAMMAAMMLPSSVPMLRIVSASNRGIERDDVAATPVAAVALGYLAAWTVFSALAAVAQLGLRAAMALSPDMALVSGRWSAIMLIGAGLYELTPLKGACLAKCRSPFGLVMHSRGGVASALRVGFDYGSYCVACCWLLMLVLFVVGVMNLPWVLLLAAAAALEKLSGAQRWPRLIIGTSLLSWGVVALIRGL